jgi:hypothetical protein
VQILEPFTALADSSGQLVVAGPSLAYYESLLPFFRGTPEPKVVLPPLERAFEAMRAVVAKVAETWGFETLSDDVATSAENNSSVILLFLCDGQSLLFTSDAGIPALTQAADILAASGLDPRSFNFIQVPHHGSKHNVGPTILNRLVGPKQSADVRLKVAVVSVAKEGAPDHPAKKVTNAFRRRGAYVFTTQGGKLLHGLNHPDRGWPTQTPVPFYTEVED